MGIPVVASMTLASQDAAVDAAMPCPTRQNDRFDTDGCADYV
jgi:hypothetical protein